MREIKFRAWDGVNIIEDVSIQGRFWYKEENGKTGDFYLIEDYPVMQYTNLKDKNGKEIYEGDIVTEHQLRVAHLGEVNHVIIWYENDAGFCFATMSEDGNERYISPLNTHSVGKTEIIGNRYENPELIETV